MINRASLQRICTIWMMLFALSSYLPLSAAVVFLKNGNTLRGEVIERDDGQIDIDIPGLGLMTFSMDEVDSIKQDAVKEVSDSASSSVDAAQRGDRTVWAIDKSLNLAEIKSEISYRFVYRRGDVKELGRSLLEYNDRFVLRDYKFPANVAAVNEDPDKFYNRTTALSRSRYYSMWGKLMRHAPKHGKDVWDIPNETSPSADASGAAPCEARIRKGSQSLVHKSYTCMNDAESFFSLAFIIVAGSVPSHRTEAAKP